MRSCTSSHIIQPPPLGLYCLWTLNCLCQHSNSSLSHRSWRCLQQTIPYGLSAHNSMKAGDDPRNSVAACRNTKSYCPVHLREWSSRWPRIAAELAAYQPHLLCLQEVDDHLWFSDVEPWLRQQLNMQGLVWCRTYGRNRGTNEVHMLAACQFAAHVHRSMQYQLDCSE